MNAIQVTVSRDFEGGFKATITGKSEGKLVSLETQRFTDFKEFSLALPESIRTAVHGYDAAQRRVTVRRLAKIQAVEQTKGG